MKYRKILCTILLIGSLVLSAITVSAEPMTAEDYAELFNRPFTGDWSSHSDEFYAAVTEAFANDPEMFVKCLSMERIYTIWLFTSPIESDQHGDTIAKLAENTTFNQAERRVVRFLLRQNYPGSEYSHFGDPIDYEELFSHQGRVDGFSADMFAGELFEVLCLDGNGFIKHLAMQEDEVREKLASSTIYGAYGPCNYIDIIELLDALDTDTFDSAELELVGLLKAETDRMHPSMDPTGTTAPTEEPTVPETTETIPTAPVVTPTPEPRDNSGYLIAAAVVLLLAAAGIFLFIFKKD